MSPRAILPLSILLPGMVLSVRAQEPGIYYPAPPASSWRVTAGIRYGTSDSLVMDIYRPAHASQASPVLVFHTIGAQRQNPAYVAWARIAASKGVVGVLADLRPSAIAEDFRGAIT